MQVLCYNSEVLYSCSTATTQEISLTYCILLAPSKVAVLCPSVSLALHCRHNLGRSTLKLSLKILTVPYLVSPAYECLYRLVSAVEKVRKEPV